MLQDFKSVSDHFTTLRSKGLTTLTGKNYKNNYNIQEFLKKWFTISD